LLAVAKSASTRSTRGEQEKEALQALLKIDPNHAEAKEMLSALNERLRQARITEWLVEAKANNSITNAWKGIASLKSLLSLDANHSEAKALLAVLEEHERVRQTKIAELLNNAKSNNNITNAWKGVASLSSLLALDANHEDARQLLPVLQQFETARQVKIAELLADAKGNTNMANARSGIELLKLVFQLDADHAEAKQLIVALEQEEKRRQVRIEELLAAATANNNITNAWKGISFLKPLFALDANHSGAKQLLALLQERELERQTRISALFAGANVAVGNNEASAATKALSELFQLDSEHHQARRLQIESVGCSSKNLPWVNSLGMRFVPVVGTDVLFSVWHTRLQDYEVFAKTTGRAWEKPNFVQGPTHPVVKVSWNDAQAFCEWLTERERSTGKITTKQSYRLPQDWEWSVAVGLIEPHAGTPEEKDEVVKDVYPWGVEWPPPRGAGNYFSTLGVDDFENTSPVESFTANTFGLHDMGGNALQWCEDRYSSTGTSRVLRGGSWSNGNERNLLSSSRLNHAPDSFTDWSGFRVVLVGAPTMRQTPFRPHGLSPPSTPAPASAPKLAPSLPPAPTPAPTPAPKPELKPAATPPPVALAASVKHLAPAMKGKRWENSLGMKFVPVPGAKVLFSVWETRQQDFRNFRQPQHTPGFAQGDTEPVIANWNEAKAFCAWLTDKERREGRLAAGQSYRLPTNQEWTAAVGPSRYPWGNQWPPPRDAGNYSPELGVDSFRNTSPVGSFKPNQFGIFDLGGNVREWCEEIPYGADNPTRTVRGASFVTFVDYRLESHERWTSNADQVDERTSNGDTPSLGFRVVLVVEGAR